MNSKEQQIEYSKEMQRLQDLIDKRNEAELRAVEELLKHPLSREQRIEQAERDRLAIAGAMSRINSF